MYVWWAVIDVYVQVKNGEARGRMLSAWNPAHENQMAFAERVTEEVLGRVRMRWPLLDRHNLFVNIAWMRKEAATVLMDLRPSDRNLRWWICQELSTERN